MSYRTGPKIVTDGLVLCLDAADRNSYPGSGSTWYDLSGNGNNGTLTNGPTFSSANHGFFVFDGSNDYVNCGLILPSTSNFTISCWFSTEYAGDNIAVFGNSSANGTNSLIMYTSTNYGNATNQLRIYGLGTEILVGSDIRNTGFRYLNLTRNSNTFSLYLDNSLDSSAYATGSFYNQLILGNAFADGRPFQGGIACSMLYNRALSANEVTQNFEATKGRFGL